MPIAIRTALRSCWRLKRGSRSHDNKPCKAPGAKQQLVERLHEDLGPEERERVEQLLAKINKAMDLLDRAGVSGSD